MPVEDPGKLVFLVPYISYLLTSTITNVIHISHTSVLSTGTICGCAGIAAEQNVGSQSSITPW